VRKWTRARIFIRIWIRILHVAQSTDPQIRIIPVAYDAWRNGEIFCGSNRKMKTSPILFIQQQHLRTITLKLRVQMWQLLLLLLLLCKQINTFNTLYKSCRHIVFIDSLSNANRRHGKTARNNLDFCLKESWSDGRVGNRHTEKPNRYRIFLNTDTYTDVGIYNTEKN